MKHYEPYNPNSSGEKKKILLTNRLLIISLTIYACSFILFVFQDQSTLPLILIGVAFGINVYGLIKGLYERKDYPEMAWNGIIGNLLMILVVLFFAGYLIYLFYEMMNMDFTIHIPRRNNT